MDAPNHQRRPFRFSVTCTSMNEPKAFLEHCRRAEDLGYSTISMADHLDDQFAPLIALTAAAGATTSIKLMSLVLANDFRHPAVLAKEATTLDQFCGGRLELGIGAGWKLTDYEEAGIPMEGAGVRIERLGETVRLLEQAFAGMPMALEGDHYQVSGLVNSPRPARPEGIPLMIAGGGRNILGLAARHGDIVGVNPGLAAGVIDERAGASATPTATDQKIGWIREAAGPRFDDIELHTRVHLAAIEDDRGSLAEAMAPAFGLTPEEALNSPHLLVGTAAQCVETLYEWRERWGITYIGIGAEAMEQMAPVVAATAGT